MNLPNPSDARIPPAERITLSARSGIALPLTSGEQLRVINVRGGQVVDTWALAASEPSEYMSMHHTRASLSKLVPAAGDDLYSNCRRPLMRLAQDTSPGVHDTLIAACDPERYRQLGATGEHASCADNYRRALAEHGISTDIVPSPLNLFMNIPWAADGTLEFRAAPARAGDYVTLEALTDVIVVLSACPQDLIDINGPGLNDIGLEKLAVSG
jgi:uncharacterized protein